MPFDASFKPLENAIRNSVWQAGFFPYRSDRNLGEPDWQEAMYRNTKAAAVFIAVCTRDPRTGGPNPNVMYELGWADCLGTPKILVIDDPEILPSDLKTRKAVMYSESGLETFEGRLCSSILARTGDTDRPAALVGPLLSQSLAVLDFVKRMHHAFQLMHRLDDLIKVVEEVPPRDALDDSQANAPTA